MATDASGTIAARNHVEFIRSSQLEWKSFEGDLEIKILSQNKAEDAFTGILRLPTPRPLPSWLLEAQAEFYVLHGILASNNGTVYPEGSYLRYPGSPDSLPIQSITDGTELLLMREGGKGATTDDPSEPSVVDAKRLPWSWSKATELAIGLTHKTLHYDPISKERTFLLGGVPWWTSSKIEFHPCAEEVFCIQGDIYMDNASDLGPMRAGDYFYRPPWISHGPMSTKHGFIAIGRHDGPLINHFTDNPDATPDDNRRSVGA